MAIFNSYICMFTPGYITVLPCLDPIGPHIWCWNIHPSAWSFSMAKATMAVPANFHGKSRLNFLNLMNRNFQEANKYIYISIYIYLYLSIYIPQVVAYSLANKNTQLSSKPKKCNQLSSFANQSCVGGFTSLPIHQPAMGKGSSQWHFCCAVLVLVAAFLKWGITHAKPSTFHHFSIETQLADAL